MVWQSLLVAKLPLVTIFRELPGEKVSIVKGFIVFAMNASFTRAETFFALVLGLANQELSLGKGELSDEVLALTTGTFSDRSILGPAPGAYSPISELVSRPQAVM